MLKRITCYAEKIFGLNALLAGLKDPRKKPQIAAIVFAKLYLLLWLSRQPSFHAMEKLVRQGAGRKFLHNQTAGADQMANNSELLDTEGLRAILGEMYKRLGRNKVLQAFDGHRLAVVDGHEINSSYCRCCDNCQERLVTVNGEKRIQFYHRVVVFQLIGPGFRFLLDLELLEASDDEGSAAIRLIKRVLENYPRCFDILLGDGLYPQARMLKLLRKHGKHCIMVLKDERRDLMVNARSLFGPQPQKIMRNAGVQYKIWDLEELDSWDSYDGKVRVVRSLETKVVYEGSGRKRSKHARETEWIWVTTIPKQEVPCETIVKFGHERWRIENEGFNELRTHWHSSHYFHHHPVSIVGLWLMLFIAYALFHTFLRNIKPCLRRQLPTHLWAQLIFADFLLPLLMLLSSG